MVIRAMTLEDYGEAYALWGACPEISLRKDDDSFDGIARFLSRNPTSCFVAEEGQRIIGTILAGHDGRRGYIYHTAVAPDCRRKGIGRLLVQHASLSFIDLGIAKAALLVYRSNLNGRTFWENTGFNERADIFYLNKEMNNSVQEAKNLSNTQSF